MKGKKGREGRGDGNEHLCSTDPGGLKQETHIKTEGSAFISKAYVLLLPKLKREKGTGGGGGDNVPKANSTRTPARGGRTQSGATCLPTCPSRRSSSSRAR